MGRVGGGGGGCWCVRWAGSEYRGLGERRKRLGPHLCDEIYPAVGSHTPHQLEKPWWVLALLSLLIVTCGASHQAGYGLSVSLRRGGRESGEMVVW